MKVIQLSQPYRKIEEAIEHLEIVDKPTPKPGPGQVLVQMESAPCNPSDLLFLQGKYGVKKAFPAVPGWEGAGTVIESGPGLMGWWLKGKRVACGGQSERDGTWAEYFVADAKACVPLNDSVSFDQGATLLVNPLTAVGMIEQAVNEGHQSIIQTAGCSQVARMVQALTQRKKIPLINIVRREEQVRQLQSEGVEIVINSEDDNFFQKLKEKAKDLNATIAFEAVAGPITGKILGAMPPKSKALVYGALSEKPCEEISPLSLIFEEKTVEGFLLSKWIKQTGILKMIQATRSIQQMIGNEEFETKIQQTVGFESWKEALLNYQKNMSKGKVILSPRR